MRILCAFFSKKSIQMIKKSMLYRIYFFQFSYGSFHLKNRKINTAHFKCAIFCSKTLDNHKKKNKTKLCLFLFFFHTEIFMRLPVLSICIRRHCIEFQNGMYHTHFQCLFQLKFIKNILLDRCYCFNFRCFFGF